MDIAIRDIHDFELAEKNDIIKAQAEDIESLKNSLSNKRDQTDRICDESYDVMKAQNDKIERLNLVIEQALGITGLVISFDETAITGHGEVREQGKHYPELFAYMMAKLIESEY
jgi:hypothetical protein